MKTYLLLTLALAMGGTSAGVASDPLHFECDFPSFADRDGVHDGPAIHLSYLYVAEKRYAQVNESSGNHKVQAVPGDGQQVSFIDISSLGNVAVTTIVASGEAIHSRNTALDGEFLSAIYYGNCTRSQP